MHWSMEQYLNLVWKNYTASLSSDADEDSLGDENAGKYPHESLSHPRPSILGSDAFAESDLHYKIPFWIGVIVISLLFLTAIIASIRYCYHTLCGAESGKFNLSRTHFSRVISWANRERKRDNLSTNNISSVMRKGRMNIFSQLPWLFRSAESIDTTFSLSQVCIANESCKMQRESVRMMEMNDFQCLIAFRNRKDSIGLSPIPMSIVQNDQYDTSSTTSACYFFGSSFRRWDWNLILVSRANAPEPSRCRVHYPHRSTINTSSTCEHSHRRGRSSLFLSYSIDSFSDSDRFSQESSRYLCSARLTSALLVVVHHQSGWNG